MSTTTTDVFRLRTIGGGELICETADSGCVRVRMTGRSEMLFHPGEARQLALAILAATTEDDLTEAESIVDGH